MRPVHTYSIVARDPATGQLGVAVQSHYFSVGSVVPWVEPGVGAIAMQSYLHLAFGPEALTLMRSGKSAPEALAELIARDPEQDLRQVGMVDAVGNAAAHTGTRCIEAAGHIVGDGYSAQANLMLNPDVWPAMAVAYESASGDLADRLMTALEAAEEAGGDLRGQQSAALVIVSGDRPQAQGAGKLFDLRVEDHPAPLTELRRLITLARAYHLVEDGDTAVGQGRHQDAAVAFKDAVALAPHIAELKLMAGLALLQIGEAAGGALLDEALLSDPRLAVLIPRLAALGLTPEDDGRWQRPGLQGEV